MCEWFWLDCIVQSWLQYYCGRLPYGGRAGQLPSQEKSQSKRFLKPFKLRHCESFVDCKCKTIYVIALFCVCVNRPMVIGHSQSWFFITFLISTYARSPCLHAIFQPAPPRFRIWGSQFLLLQRQVQTLQSVTSRLETCPIILRVSVSVSKFLASKKVSISVSKVLVSVSRTVSAVGPSL